MNIIVQNLAIHYEDQGSGPVVLLIHGWGSSLHVFDGLTTLLTPAYRVIRLDLPGFGASQKPPDTWGTVDYVRLITALCSKLELAPYAIAGHSVGGQIAVHAVGAGLLNPAKLILLAASAIRPQPGPRELVIMTLAKIGKALPLPSRLRTRLRTRLYHSAGTSEYLRDPAMQTIYRRLITQDQTALASRIAIPTLLIWGEHDTDTPLARGRLLSQLIPGSHLEVIPDASHFALTEHPAQVHPLILNFLKEP